MLRNLIRLALLAGVLLAVAPTIALAGPVRPDSDAPAGANASWLPAEDWVMERWVPFDETRLNRIVGMPSNDIAAQMDRTGETLEQLAAGRGVPTQRLAERLLASRHLPAGSPLRTTLLARTERMLTQSHLAVHMLRHVFHTWTVTRRTKAIYGVSQAQFNTMYFDQHLSMGEIAQRGGVTIATLRRRAVAAAEAAGRRGVATHAMSVNENRILRKRDRQLFLGWEEYRVPLATTATAASVNRGFLCHLPG